MLNNFVTKIIGTRFEREQKRMRPIVEAIHEHEARLAKLSDDELRGTGGSGGGNDGGGTDGGGSPSEGGGQTAKFRRIIAERTGALDAEVKRLKQAKHDTPAAEDRLKLDEELRQAEQRYNAELRKTLDDILPEAFATVREACRRLVGTEVVVTGHALKWDMVPYDVQLIGGIVLHQGKIAEMATGEGKTLVATLPLYLNALAGRGTHLVTVNNYLARRDSQWMGHVFSWLGLTVSCIDDTQPQSPERRAAYQADITYGTNNEFGFDYLRDNMVFESAQLVQRGHHYAIIDEVDSILIDEARTPLIISGPVGTEGDVAYAEHNALVVQLVRRQTAVVNDLIAKAEPLLMDGNGKDAKQQYEAAKLLYKAQLGMPKNKRLLKLLNEEGVKTQVQRVELDRLADRKMPAGKQQMRDIENDLYFVLDERGHSVHLTDKGVEVMSPRDPTLFVVPDISHAVHQIDHDEALSPQEKLDRRQAVEAEYAAKSEKLHIIHKLLQAHALYEKDVEYVVQDGQVMIVDEFTGRMMIGRRWSDGLHQAVEAKEGVTIKEESQTLATITIQNYFRMYEKLSGMTGTAETEETEFHKIYKLEVVVIPTNRPVRRVDKHDLIYKTRREKYNAIVEEVERHHKRGLPILVGTTNVEVSETLARMLKRRGLKHEVLNAKYHQREAEIVAMAGQPAAITIATNMAGRGTDIKLGPGVKKCQVCGIKSSQAPFGQKVEPPDLTPDKIKELGCNEDPPCGLVILGTERHESRRIDRQLRGRSGRQGDPGQSVFYLSLEDDLMRLFGSDRIARWMDRSGAEENEVITHPLVTSAIGQAQKRVELQNFQQRKRLLEYDDVMNQQREVIYSLRRFALEGGEELKSEARSMVEAAFERLAEGFVAASDESERWDRELMETEFLQRFLTSVPKLKDVNDRAALIATAREAGQEAFENKLKSLTDLGARSGAQEDIGARVLAQLTLFVIDEKWKDHLYDLDQLRAAIQYRAWGQKDPLIEYKTEAFDMFKGLMDDLRTTFAERWLKLQLQVEPSGGRRPAAAGTVTGPLGGQPRRQPPMVARKPDADGLVAPESATDPAPSPAAAGAGMIGAGGAPSPYAGVGRNDPCPCGSGKKFKKCHGAGS